jgi:site-specific DNA-methyltransferase (adenine-specific)
MKTIEAGSVDMVLTDPPYGTTACKWDSIIPLEPMWEQLKRVIKPNGAIVMTASQPFTTTLIASNMKMFKYCWVWDKVSVSNPQLSRVMPLKNCEDVCVFGCGRIKYNPQGLLIRDKPDIRRNKSNVKEKLGHNARNAYSSTMTNYPRLNALRFGREHNGKTQHPTQKPVALMEYLIKTYTNEGDTVLDFTMGSGTTGVACANLNRDFIGIELDEEYFKIAEKRIEDAVKAYTQKDWAVI